MRPEERAPHPDRSSRRADPQVVVGWSHRDLLNGLELRIESSRSTVALENDQVDLTRLCMTRNQALLLARYLLQVTGQSVPEEETRPPRRRWFRRS